MSNKPGEHEFDGPNDGLTPEERAALEGDEDQGALPTKDWEREFPQASGNPDAAAAGRDDGQDDEGEDDEGEGQDAGADTGADAGQDQGAPEPEAAPAKAPLLVAEVPADAEEQLTSIKAGKDELLAQLDEGDITAKEYHTQLEALNERQRKLEFAMHEAELAQKLERQRLQTEWVTTVHDFLGKNPEFKKDANPIAFNALDSRIREIATSEEGQGLTNIQILTKARDDVRKAFNMPVPDGKQDDGKGKTTGSHKPNLPPNLGKVPAAEINSDDGEFATLDRLLSINPIAYEEAIAKLDPQTLDRYLTSR